mgnify:CR=1 FL=1
MGRTKEATVLVDRVGEMHGFKKLVNNDFVFGKNRIVIRSAEPEVDNGYNRYFLGVTVSKLQKVPPDQIYLLLVLGDEDKIIYLPGDVALKLFENVPLVSKDQVKFSVWERAFLNRFPRLPGDYSNRCGKCGGDQNRYVWRGTKQHETADQRCQQKGYDQHGAGKRYFGSYIMAFLHS